MREKRNKLIDIKKIYVNNKSIVIVAIFCFVLLSIIIGPYVNHIYMNEHSLKKITDKDICIIIFSDNTFRRKLTRDEKKIDSILEEVDGYSSRTVAILDLKENKRIDIFNNISSYQKLYIADYNKNTGELIIIESLGPEVMKYDTKTGEKIEVKFETDKKRKEYCEKILGSKVLNNRYNHDVYNLNLSTNENNELEFDYYKKKFYIEKDIFFKIKDNIKKKDFSRRVYIDNIKQLNENKYFVTVAMGDKLIVTRDYIYNDSLNEFIPLANYLVDIKNSNIWMDTYVNRRWEENNYIEFFLNKFKSMPIGVYDIQFF